MALVLLTFPGKSESSSAMEHRAVWTASADAKLLSLRALGLPWDAIGQEMRVGRCVVRERGRRLGAQRLPLVRHYTVPSMEERPPLPPGHPVCWSLLTAGTVLEGEAYPYPVFA